MAGKYAKEQAQQSGIRKVCFKSATAARYAFRVHQLALDPSISLARFFHLGLRLETFAQSMSVVEQVFPSKSQAPDSARGKAWTGPVSGNFHHCGAPRALW